jgi:ABC-type transport system substrate-binding protein
VKGVVTFEVVTVRASANPALNAVAHAVVAAWTSLGLHVTLAELAPSELIQQRLLQHDFSVALLEMDLGRVPDLQPLLTSTQAVKGGTNLAGYESTSFDALLAAAHAYATPAVHAQRVAAVLTAFAAQMPFLPLVFPARVVVFRDAVTGPGIVPLGIPSDRLWDVLDWRLAP